MKAKTASLWESIRTSLWFLPALITAAAVGLSRVTLYLDRSISWDAQRIGEFFYPGGAEGARQLLSTVAGSTITVVGVSFSITIAALTLASNLFGPRLLRGFMADRGNQTVLGIFVGTFIYCLLVLRTVRDHDNTEFVPKIAVTFAIVLALASFVVLIYFFHHAASSIQAEQVVHNIYRELIAEIDRTFPASEDSQDTPQPPPEDQPGQEHGGRTVTVEAMATGYLRGVDREDLISLASDRDLVIQCKYRPGDFVFEGTPLATLTATGEMDSHVHRRVERAFILGKYRSLEQDVEFPIQQLVDMALRALSPSLNDPYTAVNCIDRLGAAICHLNGRQSPSRYRYDRRGNLRLILDVPTYEGIFDAAFNQIRQNARSSIAVSIRLLETLQAIAMTANFDAQRQIVRLHAEMIYRIAQEAATEKKDRDDLEERFRKVLQKLNVPGSPATSA